jgi:hypothetical protein
VGAKKLPIFLLPMKKLELCSGRSEAVFEKAAPEWFPLFENSFAVGRQATESGIIDEKKGYLWGAGFSFRKSLWFNLKKKGFKNLTVGRQGKISIREKIQSCVMLFGLWVTTLL